MKISVLGLLGILVVSTSAISLLPDIMLGTCVERCSNDLVIRAVTGLGGCPDGYTCRSNGCGHTCQPDLIIGQKRCSTDCPIGCNLFFTSSSCGTCICGDLISSLIG
ncbi:BPTI/Kunitz domain-containing protein 4 [Biomphalaria glabrata]|nr:BPTI/Kunitz domain-containing protein 4 [Biomphalaria glabrata]